MPNPLGNMPQQPAAQPPIVPQQPANGVGQPQPSILNRISRGAMGGALTNALPAALRVQTVRAKPAVQHAFRPATPNAAPPVQGLQKQNGVLKKIAEIIDGSVSSAKVKNTIKMADLAEMPRAQGAKMVENAADFTSKQKPPKPSSKTTREIDIKTLKKLITRGLAKESCVKNASTPYTGMASTPPLFRSTPPGTPLIQPQNNTNTQNQQSNNGSTPVSTAPMGSSRAGRGYGNTPVKSEASKMTGSGKVIGRPAVGQKSAGILAMLLRLPSMSL